MGLKKLALSVSGCASVMLSYEVFRVVSGYQDLTALFEEDP